VSDSVDENKHYLRCDARVRLQANSNSSQDFLHFTSCFVTLRRVKNLQEKKRSFAKESRRLTFASDIPRKKNNINAMLTKCWCVKGLNPGVI